MSKFVNYKKRSVTLPDGCKNLIELLQPHGLPGAISPDERPTVTRGESFIGGLSDINKHVALVFESRSRASILMVTPPEQQFTVDVDRMEDGTIEASVLVQTGTEQETAVRSFLASRGLQVPDSGMPPMFIPGAVQTICHISPMPSEAPLLSQLVSDLLRVVFGLSDDSQLRFRYYETRDAV